MRRTGILQLVAMNRLDPIEPLMTNEADRAFLKDIFDSRKNLRDRFNFEAADISSPSRQRSPTVPPILPVDSTPRSAPD